MHNHIAIQLREKGDFSLLLLTVESFDNSGSRKFIVCVDSARAKVILAKDKLTVSDYDREDIVRGFGENEAVSEDAIRSAITYFEEHSVTDALMKRKFKI